MIDPLHHFIQDLKQRKEGVFTDDDFKECREAAADIGDMIRKLETSKFKFRKKLSDAAAEHPTDKEKIIYLQGLVDGMNLAIKPLEIHYQVKEGGL